MRSALDTPLVFADCLTMLERAAALTGCDHFGLLLGARYPWKAHGLIHDLAAEAPTLRQGLLDFVTWQLGYSSGAVVYLLPMGGDFALGYGIYGGQSPGSRQMYQLCLAIGCTLLRELSGGRVAPLEIHVAGAAPADLAPWRQILQAPLRFDQLQTCLVLAGASIDMAAPRCRPGAPRRAARRGDRSASRAIAMPCRGGCAICCGRNCWARMPRWPRPPRPWAMSPRTLRRRLEAEGLTFEAVRDDVRFTVAREFLEMTRLPVGEISAALAFASHSAFDQAFRRWSGTSPSDWRRG